MERSNSELPVRCNKLSRPINSETHSKVVEGGMEVNGELTVGHFDMGEIYVSVK
jgi:hypothetical protein